MNIDKVYPSTKAAIMDFFGKKEGQDLKAFAEELKGLSTDDMAFFRAELERNGYRFAG